MPLHPGKAPDHQARVTVLLWCLGLEPDSFYRFVEWALSEQIVASFDGALELDGSVLSSPDGLKRFRDLLRKRSGRDWSEHDLGVLFHAVKARRGKHYREPISYGEYLKLLWTTPYRCAKCAKAPPEVKLHIDHVVPASLGGPSKRSNLQFLCAPCNLKKSAKLEGGSPWLDLR